MAPWRRTLRRTLEARATLAALVGEMVSPCITVIRRQQITATTRMSLLATPLAIAALALALKPLPSLEGGLYEFLELRRLFSSSWVIQVARAAICAAYSWLCSLSCRFS